LAQFSVSLSDNLDPRAVDVGFAVKNSGYGVTIDYRLDGYGNKMGNVWDSAQSKIFKSITKE